MADDVRLLHLLERALAPAPEEPPDERVAAVRLRAGWRRPADAGGGVPVGAPARDPWALAPMFDGAPSRLPTDPGSLPGPGAGRRRSPAHAGWLAAAASVAAAALVVAFLAVPSRFRGGDGAQSVAAGTRTAQARLRTALASQDPIAVAKADRELIEQAQRRPGPQSGDSAAAVAAHSDALVFLRDHPTPDVLSQTSSPPTSVTTGQAAVPTTVVVQVPTKVATPVSGSASSPTTVAGPVTTTTVAPATRSVAIVAVTPRLDGTFQVDYTVGGFTPDASARPGTWSVRFSFDGGQMPTLWGGSSPWSFPQANGVLYRQVCARVADSTGVEDPGTGNCLRIL